MCVRVCLCMHGFGHGYSKILFVWESEGGRNSETNEFDTRLKQ